MTHDEIIAELRTNDLPPAEALRAAVAHADALAPEVYALSGRFCRGICLRPEDERLHFYGLHVLAAARHQELWPHLVALARTPDEELDDLFMHHAPISLAAMMLSVWDGDTGALLRLIEHADLGDNGKWALFDVLARLTFDGRIPRETTVAFLERYEREGLADEDSQHWWGWEGAVTKLGLTDFEPALRRVWTKPCYANFNDREHDEILELLRSAAAQSADPTPFGIGGIAPVADPADALDWILRRNELFAAEDQEEPGEPVPSEPDSDPARSIRLTDEEAYWLGRFLVSRQVPATTMPLVMLDGFLTAMAIGPKPVDFRAALPAIWSEDDKAEPQWEDEAQSAYVLGLLARMMGAISERRLAGALQSPEGLEGPDAIDAAKIWADGFGTGIDLKDDAWTKLFEDRNGAEDALAVMALCDDETEYFGRPATIKERTQIIERLPVILQRIAAFWDDPAKGYPRPQPIKVEKVGRNDPCPCGSGLKYKKCCGK